jgi:peptidoglycan/xylan/chitin deacetylase (PgdA/CDA1 family)/lipoprotein-anchoring transpeptidase ErfK/SrfK
MKAKTSLAVALTAIQVAGLLALAVPARAAATFPPSEWVIGPQRRVVFLTLDGQTSSQNLLTVLEDLSTQGARASFFMSGSWVAHHPDKARLIRAGNHSMGNRGWSQAKFTSLSDAELRNSITQAQEALNAAGFYPRPFLRAPKGDRDLRVLQVAGSMGYRNVRWTYHTGGGLARKVAGKVIRSTRAGSIISLDIWRKSHRKALPMIVDGLRRKGFEFRTLEKLEGAHAIRWDVTLSSGSTGPEVQYLTKTLNATSYPAGGMDGNYGYSELEAVYAFEKVHGLARDGVVTPAQMTMLALKPRPAVPKPAVGDPKNYIDVDISRQVLFEVKKRRLVHTYPVSSGNEATYTSEGQTRQAHTPRGNFHIERKIQGERHGSLGTLYWPNYFIGGYAIHGSDSVPTYPASHGCVRIPRYLEQTFYYANPIGTPVFVHD